MPIEKETKSVLSHQELKSILRHRHPFLLVDKIVEFNDDSIVGIKNITGTDYVMEGHFPDEPIYPGVLLIEACSQVGGILVSKQITGNGYIAQINDFKFLNFLEPGDSVQLHAQFMKKFGRYVSVKVQAYVGEKAIAKGQITYFFR